MWLEEVDGEKALEFVENQKLYQELVPVLFRVGRYYSLEVVLFYQFTRGVLIFTHKSSQVLASTLKYSQVLGEVLPFSQLLWVFCTCLGKFLRKTSDFLAITCKYSEVLESTWKYLKVLSPPSNLRKWDNLLVSSLAT